MGIIQNKEELLYLPRQLQCLQGLWDILESAGLNTVKRSSYEKGGISERLREYRNSNSDFRGMGTETELQNGWGVKGIIPYSCTSLD